MNIKYLYKPTVQFAPDSKSMKRRRTTMFARVKSTLAGVAILGVASTMIFSCQTPNMEEGLICDQGLLNFFVKIPGESSEYGATKVGPYKDGDTIYVKVPTTEEQPLDVEKLMPYASLENNSFISPALLGTMNFKEPLQINVTDGQGTLRKHYIKILPTPPKTIFKKMWYKTAPDMGLLRSYISGMTVCGDNLLVHDCNIWTAEDGIRVYDYLTGELKKTVPAPTTFTMQVQSDDAGHFVVNRYNEYGAGFILYYYDNIDSPAKEILNFTAGAGCPYALGWKTSVCGNLKSGKAYVYATAPDISEYYMWEFNDGVVASHTPKAVKYSSAKEPWTYASIKRASVEPDADHYITYCIYDGNDSETLKKGSRFEIFPPSMDLVQMNPKNHGYKIFDFDVFSINGDQFLVVLQQDFWSWDGVSMKVFEITDRSKMAMAPGDSGYDKFMLLETESFGVLNYMKWGDVSVKVDGNTAYIYASIASHESPDAGILAYKMNYFPQ